MAAVTILPSLLTLSPPPNPTPYSAISAAVGSLKGPKHGGANVEVLGMMEDLKGSVKDITNEKEVEKYLLRILKGEAFDRSGLIYGLGHAVYTLSDPRAIC